MKAKEELFPFLPEVHLFHNRKKADRFIRKHLDIVPKFISGCAQTWYEEGMAVVLIEHEAELEVEFALLCHEAYHVVSLHYDYLGEEHPSDELMAYGVQFVSLALFEAHDKWLSKRAKGGK